MRGIRTSLLAKIRPLKSLISGTRDDPAEDASKVAGYWTDYNVTLHQDFRSIEESLAYLRWRNDQYFGYAALMPVNNQDGRVVLDFGCGPGHDVVGFSTESRPARLIAIDVSGSSLAEARARLALHRANCEFLQLDATARMLPLATNSVDYVHSSGVLHHVPDPLGWLREFHRVLRPDGRARIMVYNHDSVWMHLFVAYMKRLVGRAFTDLTLEQAFARTTDGKNCPIANAYRPPDFIELAGAAGFDAEFLGAAVSMHEAKILPYRFDAIQDRRMPEPSRRFLLELTIDHHGFPCYRGYGAGIDACYQLTPRV
jgi:ubiquinone/menaquinone biosynthesis C-methylase UbiE